MISLTTPESRQRLALTLLWITPALWSVNYLVARSAPGVVEPHMLALGRWSLAGLILSFVARNELWKARRSTLQLGWQYLALGTLGMLVCGAWVYQGAQTTSAMNISLIYAASPVLIALGAVLWLGERFSWRQGLGVALALAGVCHVVVKGHRCAGGQASQQLCLNAARAAHAHVNHQGQSCAVRGGGQGAPVGAGVARFGMAGHKYHAVRVLTVRERHAQAGHSGQAGGDAVDNLDLDAGSLQLLQLFAATAEDEGVSAFEADHVLPIARGRDHEFLDEVLRCGLATAALTDVDDARSCRGKSDDLVAHQVIDQEHGGGLDGLERFEREQLRITRAGADQRAACHGSTGEKLATDKRHG